MVAKLGNIANLCNLAHTRKRYTPKRNKRRCPVRRYRVGRLCKYDTMLLSFGFRIVAGGYTRRYLLILNIANR